MTGVRHAKVGKEKRVRTVGSRPEGLRAESGVLGEGGSANVVFTDTDDTGL